MVGRKSSKIENRKLKIPRRFTAPIPHLRKDSTQQSAIRPNPKSKIQNPKSAGDLLLEIGTEELPAAYLPDLINQLGREAKALLESNHLSFGEVKTFGTPRRLVLLVRALSGIQRKPAEEVRGPSKQACYDKDGKPTPALLGFLRSRNGTIEQTKLVDSEKGAYVYLIKPPVTTPTSQILQQLVPRLIGRLRAPKTMRWDESGARFARPIRWLLVLYGDRLIRTWVGGEFNREGWTVIHHGVGSNTRTRIGRPQGLREVRIASIPAYFKALTQASILFDQSQRRERIQELVQREAKRIGGVVAPEMLSGLLDEVTYLTESPVLCSGAFDLKYLELPREVLLASMAKHQRVFAVENPSDRKLHPRWIAILEGKPGKPEAVREVIERILNARLADSLLFWNEDRKRSLEELSAALSGVTFHEKLGSMADKTKRLEALSEVLISTWRVDESQATQIRRAAQLAKTDLVTNLVREFPSLQGVIGKYYALAAGVDDEVAHAIEQQYWLQEATERERRGGNIPFASLISLSLTIIEKYDTLAGYFGIGIEPTGNEDPFGLRPRARGIVEATGILINKPIPLMELFNARARFAPFQTMAASEKGRIALRIKDYLFERLYAIRSWSESNDVISAVIASQDNDDLTDVMKRIQRIYELQGSEQLAKSAKVIERTGNILKGAPATSHNGVDPALLQEPLERELYTLYESKKEEFIRLVEGKSYAEATALFGETFYAPLHDFFDKVLVNVENESVRHNRLALMSAIRTLYTGRIADLSKLTLLQQKERA